MCNDCEVVSMSSMNSIEDCWDNIETFYLGNKCKFYDNCGCYTTINQLDKKYDHTNTKYTLGIHRDDICEGCKWQLGGTYRVVVEDVSYDCSVCMNTFRKLNILPDCNHKVCDDCHYNMTKLPDYIWEEWQFCQEYNEYMTEDHVDIFCATCPNSITKRKLNDYYVKTVGS